MINLEKCLSQSGFVFLSQILPLCLHSLQGFNICVILKCFLFGPPNYLLPSSVIRVML